MDVRHRPEWLKRAENKVFERKLQPSMDAELSLTVEAEAGVDASDGDGDHASVLIEITPFPSNPQRPLSSSSHSQPRDQMENLKRHQEAQMQSLFDEQKRRVGGLGSFWQLL